ncbi:MAG TPA: hypothetical protein VJV79_21995 [Polyangiaceae bacterium]|nr:hypothetical protein [Polyangiaceae bacterium]
MGLKRAIAQSMLTAAVLFAGPRAFADDAPVERPAVDRPALPQTGPAQPAPPASEAGQGAKQGGSANTGSATRSGSAHTATGAPDGAGDRQRSFLYVAPGLGLLSGLSGGQDFERTNPALTGAFGVEIPLARATGLGIELNGDLELAGQADRGTYTSVLLRARLGQMLSARSRVWGALGLGGAGYQTGSLAFGLAAGTSLMLVPKFGLDFSANLNLLTAGSSVNSAGVQNDYNGGAVLLFAIRALFEFRR